VSEPEIKSVTIVVHLADDTTQTIEVHEGSQIKAAFTHVNEYDWTARDWLESFDLIRVPFRVTHHYRLDIVAGLGAYALGGAVMTMTVNTPRADAGHPRA
jgi:hypothetical protein